MCSPTSKLSEKGSRTSAASNKGRDEERREARCVGGELNTDTSKRRHGLRGEVMDVQTRKYNGAIPSVVRPKSTTTHKSISRWLSSPAGVFEVRAVCIACRPANVVPSSCRSDGRRCRS